MKRFLRASTAILLLMFLLPLQAAPVPADIVRTTTDDVLARVTADKETLRADPGKMFNLVSEVIFPHFDFTIMSQWVLGEHWSSADEASRAAFVDQFRKLLVRTYATALLEFSDQTITYPDTEQKGGANTALVRQEISQEGGAPMPILYRLHNKTGEWKVFDVSVDGVSLVKTYRASFGAMIKDGSLAALIDELATKNKQYSN